MPVGVVSVYALVCRARQNWPHIHQFCPLMPRHHLTTRKKVLLANICDAPDAYGGRVGQIE